MRDVANLARDRTIHPRQNATDLFDASSRDERSAGAEMWVPYKFGHRRDFRHTRVRRPERGYPLVARLRRECRAKVGTDRILLVVVGLLRNPLFAPQRATQIREEVWLDRR